MSSSDNQNPLRASHRQLADFGGLPPGTQASANAQHRCAARALATAFSGRAEQAARWARPARRPELRRWPRRRVPPPRLRRRCPRAAAAARCAPSTAASTRHACRAARRLLSVVGLVPLSGWPRLIDSSGIASTRSTSTLAMAHGQGCPLTLRPPAGEGAVLVLLVGARGGLLRLLLRRDACPVRAGARRQGPHVVLDQAHERWNQRQRRAHRDGDDDGRRQAHRADERHAGEVEAEDRDDDRAAGDDDRRARRALGAGRRGDDVHAVVELLAVPGREEQPVVDRDAEAEQGGDCRRHGREGRCRGEQPHHRQARADAEDRGHQRDRCRDEMDHRSNGS